MFARAKLIVLIVGILVDQLIRLLVLHFHIPINHGSHLFTLPLQVLWLLLVAFILYLVSPVRGNTPAVLLAAGTLSNLLSSVSPGGIIDYIPCGSFYTNSADLFITGGAIWLMYLLIRRQWGPAS